MLLLILILFSFYELYYSDDVNGHFDETLLVRQLHDNIIKAKNFFDEVSYKKINEQNFRAQDSDQETTKDADLRDYSLTDIWWSANPELNLPKTAPATFLPTPVGHGRFPAEIEDPPTYYTEPTASTPSTPRPPVYYPFGYTTPSKVTFPPHLTMPSFPFSVPTTTEPPMPVYSYIYTIYPGVTLPPGAPTVYPTLPGDTYIPSPTGPIPKPSFTLPEIKDRPVLTYPTAPWSTVRIYPDSDPENDLFFSNWTLMTTRHEYTTQSTTLDPIIKEYVKNYMQEVLNQTIREDMLQTPWITHSEPFTTTTTTTTPATVPAPPAGRTLSKAQAWVRKRHKMKYRASERLPPIQRQVTPKAEYKDRPYTSTTRRPGPSHSKPSLHKGQQRFHITSNPHYPDYFTATAPQDKFFQEKEGWIFTGSIPPHDENTQTIIVTGLPAYVPPGFTSTTPTTAGDVLHGNIVFTKPSIDPRRERLYKMMDDLREGYMMVFFLEMSRLVALKNSTDVFDVFHHCQGIVNNLYQNARLTWMGPPLMEVAVNLGIFFSEIETDVLQSYANMMYRMLKDRKQNLGTDTNSMIDYADLLYKDIEGELLFDILLEFDDYPNTAKSGFEMADHLIKYFLMPFRRLINSQRLQSLLDSINHALVTRFPGLQHRRHFISQENNPSFEEVTKHTENKRIRYRRLRANRSKDTPNINQETKSNKQEMSKTSDKNPKSRSTKTKSQYKKRYDIVTSKYYTKTNSKTTVYFMNFAPISLSGYHEEKAGKPYQDGGHDFHSKQFVKQNKNNEESFEYGITEKQNVASDINLHESVQEITTLKQLKQTRKKSEVRRNEKIKAELLRKIMEDSSYSDEEEALKINLIGAFVNTSVNSNNTRGD